jgi:hypothetical protein
MAGSLKKGRFWGKIKSKVRGLYGIFEKQKINNKKETGFQQEDAFEDTTFQLRPEV